MPNNVRLANVTGGRSNPYGIATSIPAGLPALPAEARRTTLTLRPGPVRSRIGPLATTLACGAANANVTLPPDWPAAPAAPVAGAQTLVPAPAPILSRGPFRDPRFRFVLPGMWSLRRTCRAGCPAGAKPAYPHYPYYPINAAASTWNLIDGYLRVEYKDVNGVWHGVTNEWLGLGFARGSTVPNAPGANPVNPNAILIVQEIADRDGNGALDINSIAPVCTKHRRRHLYARGPILCHPKRWLIR